MKLYNLTEPTQQDDGAKPSLANGHAVGIDLGTTNSLVAVSKNHKVEIIPIEGTNFLPSIVGLLDGNLKVGKSALKLEHKIRSIKRFMGEGAKKIFADKTPVELSALILNRLKVEAEKYLGADVTHAVITVPAYFDESSRQATKDAAKLAGLDVLRLINEPTAAAIAYRLDNNDEGIFAIYDLGGGTFDITILKMSRGVLQVLATGGDSNLGGDDFDKILVKKINTDADNIDSLLLAQKLKEELSSQETIESAPITKAEFEALILPIVDRTLNIFENCVKDAEVELDEIKEIILVGGSTRIPLIKDFIKKKFGIKPLDSINPDEAVAKGAAIQAEALIAGSNSLLLDVIPLSLGIEIANGLVEPIITRNTPIPVAKKQLFTTQQDNQTGFKIHVLQGESEKMSHCRSLAKFELKNIPPLPAGEARLEINFKIDADGLLSVSARELSKNIVQEIVVKPSYGLTEEELMRLMKKQ